MTTQREELAAIIEAHTMSTRDETCCSCGAWFNVELAGAIDIQHRDHLADALIPFIERAKVGALRDAAVVCRRFPGVDDTDISTARWLYLRADAIEKGNGR